MATERIRVAFYATALGGGGGMERYARELLRALGERSDLDLVVIVSAAGREEPASLVANNLVDVVVLGGPGVLGRSIRERHGVARQLRDLGVDVVHGTKHFLPRLDRASVLTVHDLMVLTWPEQFPWMKRVLLPRQYRASLQQATRLIAVSEATCDRLATIDPRLAAKTTVIPSGVAVPLLEVRAEPLPGLDGRPFALVVGDLSPRKNVGLLLEIWDDVAHATDGLTLVAVGPHGWRSRGTERRLGRLATRGEAVWAQHVPDPQLRWCYEHTQVVLVPSREEGFGLPVLEALALGAPVVASTDAALVEVAAGHARHVDPDDREGWTQAIVETVSRRRDDGSTSRGAPTLPSWRDCAEQTVGTYRRAVRDHLGAS